MAAAAADCVTHGPMYGPWPVQKVWRLRRTRRMAIMPKLCGVGNSSSLNVRVGYLPFFKNFAVTHGAHHPCCER